jgi:hypothetical protein
MTCMYTQMSCHHGCQRLSNLYFWFSLHDAAFYWCLSCGLIDLVLPRYFLTIILSAVLGHGSRLAQWTSIVSSTCKVGWLSVVKRFLFNFILFFSGSDLNTNQLTLRTSLSLGLCKSANSRGSVGWIWCLCHCYVMSVILVAGSTLEAMALAVEKSAVVLVCMSQRYKDSPNCRTGE